MTDSKRKIEKPEEDWREKLTPEQYQVTRQAGTERPFQNEYWDCKQAGSYHCVCCGAKLFESDSKYDSGTGWPSFDRPVDADAVSNRSDTSHGILLKHPLRASQFHNCRHFTFIEGRRSR